MGRKVTSVRVCDQLREYVRAKDKIFPSHQLVRDVIRKLDTARDTLRGASMEALQGAFLANLGCGNYGFLVVTTGEGVRLRLYNIAERRWDQWQGKVFTNIAQRKKFDKSKVRLPQLVYTEDGKAEVLYLIGFLFAPGFLVETFSHWLPVMSKDMAHCRKAAGARLMRNSGAQ